jgi:hypothetical protein
MCEMVDVGEAAARKRRGGARGARCCWNLIKGLIVPYISSEFYIWTGRGGSSNMVSKSGGLKLELWPHIFHCA